MKSFSEHKLVNKSTTAPIQNSSEKKKKKFPKISEIDPDEKPKKNIKQEEILNATNMYSPSLDFEQITSSIEKIQFSLQNLQEISLPIIKKLSLQKEQGITKTNFLVKTKCFDEVEIQITMYDTNPFSYHIRLAGNDKIRELSMKHQAMLTNQIKQSLPKIQVHIATPILREKDRFKIKKKKSVVKTKSSCYGAIKKD